MSPCLSISTSLCTHTHTHTLARARWLFLPCVCCSNDTTSRSVQTRALGTIEEDGGVRVFVCLGCNIHFPGAVCSLIRPGPSLCSALAGVDLCWLSSYCLRMTDNRSSSALPPHYVRLWTPSRHICARVGVWLCTQGIFEAQYVSLSATLCYDPLTCEADLVYKTTIKTSNQGFP